MDIVADKDSLIYRLAKGYNDAKAALVNKASSLLGTEGGSFVEHVEAFIEAKVHALVHSDATRDALSKLAVFAISSAETALDAMIAQKLGAAGALITPAVDAAAKLGQTQLEKAITDFTAPDAPKAPVAP